MSVGIGWRRHRLFHYSFHTTTMGITMTYQQNTKCNNSETMLQRERERECVCVRPYILSHEQMLSCEQLSGEGGRDRCIELPSGIEHHRVLLHLKQTKISICIVFALTGLNVCFGRFKLCKSNAKHASLGRRIALRFEGALSSTVTTSTTSTQTIST